MTTETKTLILLPLNVREAIEHILEHYWDDGHADYHSRSIGERPGHVFETMVYLYHWLESSPLARHETATTLSTRPEGWSL